MKGRDGFVNRRPQALRRAAATESIRSTPRIEGSKPLDQKAQRFLPGLDLTTFATRDEQEAAGHTRLPETIFPQTQKPTATGTTGG